VILLGAILLAGAGAGAWVAYFRWKDKRHPEPMWILLFALVTGAAAVAGASFGYQALDLLGARADWASLEGPAWPAALRTAVVIGSVEEGLKLAPVAIIAWTHRHFDEPLDGFVYAGAASAGFAWAETAVIAAHNPLGWIEIGARAAASPITHALFAAPWGLGLARWVLRGDRLAVAIGFAVSALLHGAYDLLLARPELRLFAPLLIGVLWTWMLRTALILEREPHQPR
jgi:RsiW-degrading membrane proteinase PrsW (M82 family)